MNIASRNALASAFGTDKWGAHFYTQHYQRYFAPIRENRLKVLEIGVGGYSDLSEGAASLKMWKHYFPKLPIYLISEKKNDEAFDDLNINLIRFPFRSPRSGLAQSIFTLQKLVRCHSWRHQEEIASGHVSYEIHVSTTTLCSAKITIPWLCFQARNDQLTLPDGVRAHQGGIFEP